MSCEKTIFTASLTCLPTVTRAVGSDSPFKRRGVISSWSMPSEFWICFPNVELKSPAK